MPTKNVERIMKNDSREDMQATQDRQAIEVSSKRIASGEELLY